MALPTLHISDALLHALASGELMETAWAQRCGLRPNVSLTCCPPPLPAYHAGAAPAVRVISQLVDSTLPPPPPLSLVPLPQVVALLVLLQAVLVAPPARQPSWSFVEGMCRRLVALVDSVSASGQLVGWAFIGVPRIDEQRMWWAAHHVCAWQACCAPTGPCCCVIWQLQMEAAEDTVQHRVVGMMAEMQLLLLLSSATEDESGFPIVSCSAHNCMLADSLPEAAAAATSPPHASRRMHMPHLPARPTACWVAGAAGPWP